MSAPMAFRARKAFQLSMRPDSPYRKARVPASAHSPSVTAPTTDTRTRAFMSGRRRTSERTAAGAEWNNPPAMAMTKSTRTIGSRPAPPRSSAVNGAVSCPISMPCHARAPARAAPLVPTSRRRPYCSQNEVAAGAPDASAAGVQGCAFMPSRATAEVTSSGSQSARSMSTVIRPSMTWNERLQTPGRPASSRRISVASLVQSSPSIRKSSCSVAAPLATFAAVVIACLTLSDAAPGGSWAAHTSL